jgi:IS5 family transposase
LQKSHSGRIFLTILSRRLARRSYDNDMLALADSLSRIWCSIQASLFPNLEEDLGPLTEGHKRVVTALEVARVEAHIPSQWPGFGRPEKSRVGIARALVAKTVLKLPTTRALLDRLECDPKLRRICGFERKKDVPSEAIFSRAFAEFAEGALPQRVHEALIKETHKDRIVGHISRDSTAIEAREKPVCKAKVEKPKRRRGRPKEGEEQPKEPTRLQQQLTMDLEANIKALPKACDVGTKRNSQGHQESWIGYKLHIDAGDGEIPISLVLTSASTHDSQVAIPLTQMTADRVVSCYDLMDAAYDADEIRKNSRTHGHVPIIDINPRRNAALKEELKAEDQRKRLINFQTAGDLRYNERTTVERINARIKDDFGGRTVRVRGHAKVMCHLMFGVLALTAEQLMRLIM